MVDLAVIRGRHPSFCSHSDRFPFWALSTKLRAQAQAQGRVFMRNTLADNLTVADIREKLNSDDGECHIVVCLSVLQQPHFP